MKKSIKILLVLLSITTMSLTACKKKDAEKDHLNPPGWIQFTWTKYNPLLLNELGYRFTSDNILTVSYLNGTGAVVGNLIESLKDKDYSISEQSTSASYQFTIHYNDTNSDESWQFDLLPSGQLQYTDNEQNTIIYTKRN